MLPVIHWLQMRKYEINKIKDNIKWSSIDSLRSASFLRAAAVLSSKLFVEETAKDMRSFCNIFVSSLQQQVPEKDVYNVF